MTLSIKDAESFERFGKVISGDETNLDLIKFARIKFLKEKMRPMLASQIGDTLDNIADTVRAVVLGDAINLGLVTDKVVIESYTGYIKAMLDGYGGAESIIAVLSENMSPLNQQLTEGYFVAKSQILSAETEDEVRIVDLPGEVVIAR